VNSPAAHVTRRRLWLVAGVGAVAAAFPLDNCVDAALDVTQLPGWEKLAWWCSKLGEGWVVAAAGIVFALLFIFLQRPKAAGAIAFVAVTALLTGLAGTILRVLIGRTRPGIHGPHGVAPGFYGVWHDGHWIIGKAAFSAFPSGHAAVVVGLATAAWLVHRGWGAVALLYALAVVWSRVALQWHHLSDVLASTVLAITLAQCLKPRLLPSLEFQCGNLNRAGGKA